MKLFVVIDVGCHECGVSSESVGAFLFADAAEAARLECETRTKGWRQGGQTIAEVFEIDAPDSTAAGP